MDEDYLAGPELNEAVIVAQNRPLWRLMSTFDATHPWWCVPHKKRKRSVPTRVNIHCLIECADEYVDFSFYALSLNCSCSTS